MKAPEVNFSVTYNGKNITAEISKYTQSITYTDKAQGEADDVEIELEDIDGRWRNGWYPEKGAKLSVTIGSLRCGTFEIDEIELKGPPDTVTIKGIAAGITGSLRTKKSDAHENKTLRQIAEKVASKNSLTVQGEIPEISIGRVTQHQETDLAFLKRIGRDYGVMFSVRDQVMTFTSIYGIEARSSSFSVDKTDLATYSIKDKADGMIKEAKVSSKNAKKNEAVSTNLEFEKYKQDNPQYTSEATTSGDTGTTYSRTENTQQAEAKAKAIMHLSASNQQTGTFEMQFNPLAVAGNNFGLTGFGKLSGKWNITSSSHRFEKGAGATSTLECKRLQLPTTTEKVSKPKAKPKSTSAKVVNQKNDFPRERFPGMIAEVPPTDAEIRIGNLTGN